MVTKRFPIQLLFRIKHWLGQYVITMDIMRVGFPSLVQAYSRYTAIKLLLFLPLPLAIKQGGFSSGYITYPIAFSSFSSVVVQGKQSGGACEFRVWNTSKTGFQTAGDRETQGLFWIAIGY